MSAWVSDPLTPSGFRWDRTAASVTPPTAPVDPVAMTAGEQDHSNPWLYAGNEADPPADPSLTSAD